MNRKRLLPPDPLGVSIAGVPMTHDEERIFDAFRAQYIDRYGLDAFEEVIEEIESIHFMQGYREFVRALCHWTYPPEDVHIALAMARVSYLRSLARNRSLPAVSPGKASDPKAERVSQIVACWPIEV